MASQSNPFTLLFPSAEELQENQDDVRWRNQKLGNTLMRIFLFTASESESPVSVGAGSTKPRFVVFPPQLARDEQLKEGGGKLDMQNYVQGLMERLQLGSPSSHLLSHASGLDRGLYSREKAVEVSGVQYLAYCYARAQNESADIKNGSDWKIAVIQDCKKKISELAGPLVCTEHRKAILQSRGQIGEVFINLLFQTISGKSSVPEEFFTGIADAYADNLETLKTIFDPALAHLFNSCQNASLSTPDMSMYLNVLEVFSKHPALSKVVVTSQYWLPTIHLGKSFESHTLIGRLLSPSSLAPSPVQPSEHFSHQHDLYKAEVDSATDSVQLQLQFITERMLKVFNGLLRAGPESKKSLIAWLAECFERNGDRGKMASRYGPSMGLISFQTASDGFFLNLSWVMLHLSAPFMGGKKGRLVTIDASYCAAGRGEVQTLDGGGPLVDFSGETKLVPASEGVQCAVTPKAPFNFVTHCFFLTHRCLMLGMTQVLHRFEDIMRAYSRVRQTLVNIQQGGGGGPVLQQTQQQFWLLQSQLLGLKAHTVHPQLLDLCLSFYTTTSQWLVQLVASGSHDSQEAPCDPSTLFPLPDEAPVQLQLVPECLVENMANFAMFLRWYTCLVLIGRQHQDHLFGGMNELLLHCRQTQSDTLASASHHMHHLLTFVTIFMGSSQFVHNPHIRAKLAQLLSLMIPRQGDDSRGLVSGFSESQRALFESHQLASDHLLEAVLKIFIDIEFTGESMEFEDKFQYRLPMYEVLEFLWRLPSYKPSIDALCQEVLESHERLATPVFLRFTNMMINDATVQLDEGLDYLTKIKEIEDLIDTEEWQTYSKEKKEQNQQMLSEATMMAKNRNLLARKTVHTLELLTSDNSKPFVIPTMVDRMSAMLNYVLQLLVGPKSKELKVRNAAKYHFDPKELVSGIITIYLNLGKESCFCEALPRDGRSFSMDLFPQADRVLSILNKPVEMRADLQVLAERVRQCQRQMLEEEGAYVDAPEKFLDPVTNELMRDPVTLPTSDTTMDRANIIRHLLSDQCDPFNRAPLTADMLEPNHELRKQIEEWKAEMAKKFLAE